jgi:hypothetical protein
MRYTGIVGQKIAVTRAGIIAAAHRAGEGTLAHYLAFVRKRGGTIGLSIRQLNNLGKDFGFAETRLREAQNLPYYPIGWPATIPDPHPPKLRYTPIP